MPRAYMQRCPAHIYFIQNRGNSGCSRHYVSARPLADPQAPSKLCGVPACVAPFCTTSLLATLEVHRPRDSHCKLLDSQCRLSSLHNK